MLTARLRKIDRVTVEAEGDSLADVRGKILTQTPEGFELISAPVSMAAGGGTITAVGTFERRDTHRDIEGETRADLLAQIPEGWQMQYTLRQ